jgi:hypothetical protein
MGLKMIFELQDKYNLDNNYEPPILSFLEDEIIRIGDFLTAKSGMGMCKHTYG